MKKIFCVLGLATVLASSFVGVSSVSAATVTPENDPVCYIRNGDWFCEYPE